jgi:hypothetical protein
MAHPTSLILAAVLPRALRPRPKGRTEGLLLLSCSFFFLYEWVRNLFASVDGRDDNQKGAACDDEAELAIPDVAVLVYTTSDTST